MLLRNCRFIECLHDFYRVKNFYLSYPEFKITEFWFLDVVQKPNINKLVFKNLINIFW